MPAIKTHDLTRYYGPICGIKNLSLQVPEGVIFGFLGANGAGKTTTIRLLLGLLKASKGKIEILGEDIKKKPSFVQERIGYLPGELNLYPQVKGERLLDLFSSFYQNGRAWRKKALEALELARSDLKRPLGEYSLGMKQKLGLIQAVQHQPELLIMDEPSTGLDPVMQRNFHELMEELKKEGTTIFMSSHNLAEVEICCNEVAIIYQGELVARENLAQMKRERYSRIEFSLSIRVKKEEMKISDATWIHFTGREGILKVEGDVKPYLKRLAKLPLTSLQIKEASLAEIFFEYYERGSGKNKLL